MVPFVFQDEPHFPANHASVRRSTLRKDSLDSSVVKNLNTKFWSQSRAEKILLFKQELRNLSKNLPFIIFLIAHGLNRSIYNGISTFISPVIKRSFADPESDIEHSVSLKLNLFGLRVWNWKISIAPIRTFVVALSESVEKIPKTTLYDIMYIINNIISGKFSLNTGWSNWWNGLL